MEIAGLVVLLSRLMLTVAASAGVMDGTTTQSGIEVRVICLAGAMVTLGNKGNIPDWPNTGICAIIWCYFHLNYFLGEHADVIFTIKIT